MEVCNVECCGVSISFCLEVKFELPRAAHKRIMMDLTTRN